jgi:uncharacterized protein (DUF433 family)
MQKLQMRVVVSDPGILDGEPVFRGTRVPFRNLVDYLEGGDSLEEFLEGFDIEREAAVQALQEMNRTDLLQLEGARNIDKKVKALSSELDIKH